MQYAGATTAGVVSTAVMVLRAARLVIAIAPRRFEFGGGARLGAGAAQIDNSEEADLLVGNGFRQARAHAKTQSAGSGRGARAPRRAQRSVGARASVTALHSPIFVTALAQGSLSPLRRRAQAANAAHTATAPLRRAGRPRRDPPNRARR